MKCRTAVVFAALLATIPARADLSEFHLIIQNHRFEPATLTVPAGQKFKLVVENRDATPEEFESHPLNREKVVPPNGRITLYLGPLDPGQYPFFGEFNPSTATGTLVAR